VTCNKSWVTPGTMVSSTNKTVEKIKYDIITSIACLKKPILSILDLKYHQDTFLRLHLPFTQNMGMASTHNNILH
jgi:hypothetical protein